MSRLLQLFVGLALALFAGCGKQEAKIPPPQEATASAAAEFCGMSLAEMEGPKGQIFVRDQAKPLWFGSVRDTLAFLLLPEFPKNIVAVYVTDMAKARDWKHPEQGAWVEARQAYYVIESRKLTAMHTAEAVPFSTEAAAKRFAAEYGGHVVRFAEIPRSYILTDEAGAGS